MSASTKTKTTPVTVDVENAVLVRAGIEPKKAEEGLDAIFMKAFGQPFRQVLNTTIIDAYHTAYFEQKKGGRRE